MFSAPKLILMGVAAIVLWTMIKSTTAEQDAYHEEVLGRSKKD